MIGLALWLVLLGGAAALSVSVASALSLRALGAWLDRVAPRARARIFAFAALLPLVGAALVIGAVLVPHPWLGLPEHCVSHDDHHLHLCALHGAPAPSLALVALAALLVLHVAGVLVVEAARALRASAALRRLRAAGAWRDGVIVLPIEGPIAFTAGWLRPQVFASAAVLDAHDRRAVIAHERDHARHRDPLARLAARFSAALHAPGIGGWIARSLATAQELAADEHAARAVGDRLEVAEQILALAREPACVPRSVAAFAEGDVAQRVSTLLDPPAYVRGPSLAHHVALVALAAVATSLGATSIHHALEALLSLAAH